MSAPFGVDETPEEWAASVPPEFEHQPFRGVDREMLNRPEVAGSTFLREPDGTVRALSRRAWADPDVPLITRLGVNP